MNYLAHLYLARHDEEAMVGALLGDFVGSARLGDWPAPVQREIRLHWRIDAYTDHHPAVRAAKARFPEGRRRYAGIVLDVYFDHLIARDWPRWHAEPLDAFNARVYGLLMSRLPALPDRLRRIAPRMAEGDWLGSYRRRAAVDRAVHGIATRLSRNGDKLVQALDVLHAHEAAMDAAFEDFFPDLIDFVAGERAAQVQSDAGAAG